MVERSSFALAALAFVLAAVALLARSLRADLRRAAGRRAEHESAHAGRVGFP